MSDLDKNPELYKQMRSVLKSGNQQEFIDLLKLHPPAIGWTGVFGTWLHESVKFELFDVVRHLILMEIDVNTKAGIANTNALCEAAKNGNTEVIRLLLDAGCEFDLSSPATNPLFVAIESGNTSAARMFIQHGIDTSVTYGDPPVSARTKATYLKQTDVLDLLGGPEIIRPCIATPLPDFTGTPMTPDKIAVIEKVLNCEFPTHLRTFLLNEFPSRLYHPDALDNDEWKWLGEDSMLFHTVRSYLGYNLKRPWDANDSTLLFEQHIAIGTNGGGDMWCVLKDGLSESVFVHEHEVDVFRHVSNSLAEFANRFLQ